MSESAAANRVLVVHGLQADWLGDNSSAVPLAAGERVTRHNGLNTAWVDVAKEGLTTPVVQCFKGARNDLAARARAKAAYSDLNDGHIADWAARGAGKAGRHLVGETKCYDPHVMCSSGAGSRGGVAMMGATRAFGNTEEMLIIVQLG